MSAATDAVSAHPEPAAPGPPPTAAGLRRRQLWGVLRLELRRRLLSREAFAVYFLAGAPVALALLWAAAKSIGVQTVEITSPEALFAVFFPPFLLGPLFLSVLFVFSNAFRTEIQEKSLHYYLLTPVRRPVLVLGKYLAAFLATAVPFAISTVLVFVFFLLHWGPSMVVDTLTRGPGFALLLQYVGVTLLACATYGALFTLGGLIFKNPLIPGAVLWGWETASFFLPATVKRFGVIHYLQSLYPVPVSSGSFFEILSEPTPAYLAVPGLLIFTALVLAAASWRLRSMDLAYGAD